MELQMEPYEQYLVTYLKPTRSGEVERVAYDTAYTSKQRIAGVKRCVARYGHRVGVKASPADTWR